MFLGSQGELEEGERGGAKHHTWANQQRGGKTETIIFFIIDVFFVIFTARASGELHSCAGGGDVVCQAPPTLRPFKSTLCRPVSSLSLPLSTNSSCSSSSS